MISVDLQPHLSLCTPYRSGSTASCCLSKYTPAATEIFSPRNYQFLSLFQPERCARRYVIVHDSFGFLPPVVTFA